MKVTYSIALCAILLFGCKKEEVQEDQVIYVGQYPLLSSSAENFPYNDSLTEFTFTDNLNNDIKASTTAIDHHFTNTYQSANDYNSNPSLFIEYINESYRTTLSIPSLNKEIKIEAFVSVDVTDYESIKYADILKVYHTDITSSKQQMVIVLDERTRPNGFPEASVPDSSLTINGKTFTNVYSNKVDKAFIIYFNLEEGVVGFKDNTAGLIYNLK